MITAELKNGWYLIKFTGKKNQFNEYIQNINKAPGIKFDFEHKCYTIPASSLPYLQNKFKDIQFLDEVQTVTKSKVAGYEDMGKDMKLTPYDYQKEAIKFGIDHKNILIVYPCGSGKECI